MGTGVKRVWQRQVWMLEQSVIPDGSVETNKRSKECKGTRNVFLLERRKRIKGRVRTVLKKRIRENVKHTWGTQWKWKARREKRKEI